MNNFWTAQLYFSAFAAWAFGAYLAFGSHHWVVAVLSTVVSLAYMAFGIYIVQKPDKPDPPTRGTGGFAAA